MAQHKIDYQTLLIMLDYYTEKGEKLCQEINFKERKISSLGTPDFFDCRTDFPLLLIDSVLHNSRLLLHHHQLEM